MDISVKKLKENATLPTRGSEYAAGYDLYAAIDETVVIGPHETQKIGTGLAFSLPDNTFAAVFARSGLATKEGLRPANCVGEFAGKHVLFVDNNDDRNILFFLGSASKIV